MTSLFVIPEEEDNNFFFFVENVDYVFLSEQRTLNSSVNRTCVDVVILQNEIETGSVDRDFNVAIFMGNIQGSINVRSDLSLTIAIQDNDGESWGVW